MLTCPSQPGKHLDTLLLNLFVLVHQAAHVTVEGPPISFSPFLAADCTLLSHFSFNDFVAIAFPDLAKDLDIQI